MTGYRVGWAGLSLLAISAIASCGTSHAGNGAEAEEKGDSGDVGTDGDASVVTDSAGESADETEPLDGAHDGSQVDHAGSDWCPFDGTSCPDGCLAVIGEPYDAARNCMEPGVIEACAYAIDASTDVKCRVRIADGRLFVFPLMAPTEPDVPGWRECTDAERAEVAGDPTSCP